ALTPASGCCAWYEAHSPVSGRGTNRASTGATRESRRPTMSSSKTKHRLCLASPVFFPTYGGSLLRFKRYLPGLSQRGLDIRVYTGTPHNKEMSAEESAQWGGYPVGEFMPCSEI